jgi:hypothetical protein
MVRSFWPVSALTEITSGGWPAKRSFQASFFDYVRVADGRIIERVQQAGMLAQMRHLYGRALGLVGLDSMFLRQ